MDIDDRVYLTPPDNEVIPVLKCFFCDEDIYVGDQYYVLNGFNAVKIVSIYISDQL